MVTWPEPVASGHLGADFDASVSETERLYGAETRALDGVDDVGWRTGTFAAKI